MRQRLSSAASGVRMPESTCPFCFTALDRTFHEGPLTLALWDAFPVSPAHALLIPRRHVATWFDATPTEQSELTATIAIARDAILRRLHPQVPDGFNIGINVGAAGGQTVFHLHVHIVPRRDDDGLTLPWTGQAPAKTRPTPLGGSGQSKAR